LDANVARCIDAIRSIARDEAEVISAGRLESLADEIYRNDPALSASIQTKSGQFNPRGPVYIFVHQIVAYCCVFYSVIDVVGKLDHVADILLDRNVQPKIVERAVEKLRLIGLNYTAEQVSSFKDKVLDYLTKPSSSPINVTATKVDPE
jgi:hypothetical protein